MKYRFYDIVAEFEDGERAVDQQFTAEVPDHDMSCVLERQEHIGRVLDAVVSASGLNVCSFSYEPVSFT